MSWIWTFFQKCPRNVEAEQGPKEKEDQWHQVKKKRFNGKNEPTQHSKHNPSVVIISQQTKDASKIGTTRAQETRAKGTPTTGRKWAVGNKNRNMYESLSLE